MKRIPLANLGADLKARAEQHGVAGMILPGSLHLRMRVVNEQFMELGISRPRQGPLPREVRTVLRAFGLRQFGRDLVWSGTSCRIMFNRSHRIDRLPEQAKLPLAERAVGS